MGQSPRLDFTLRTEPRAFFGSLLDLGRDTFPAPLRQLSGRRSTDNSAITASTGSPTLAPVRGSMRFPVRVACSQK